jgi:hypothetical protein
MTLSWFARLSFQAHCGATSFIKNHLRSAMRHLMKAVKNRIDVADLHGGGVLITSPIFLFGDATPRVLKAIARVLAYLLGDNSSRCG